MAIESPLSGSTSQSLKDIRESRTRAAISIFLNLLLAVGKAVAGILGSSTALIGDAIHSATDVVASAAAFAGLWIAGKEHPSFPYGLYKAETIATLVISVAIILAGYEVGRSAVLGGHSEPDVAIAFPVAVASLLIALAFGVYQLKQGKRLNSKALEADAKDYLADAMSTGVVVASLCAAWFGLNLDRYAAGVVAVFIFWAGGHLLWQSVMDLMDEAIDRETDRKIIALVEAHPRVEEVERCLSRTAGGRFIVDLDVVLRRVSHDLAHRIAHALESEIIQAFPRVVMARIKTHSSESTRIQRITPVDAYEGQTVMHFSRAPWFLMETIERDKGTIDVRYLKNPYLAAESRRGIHLGGWLLKQKPDQVVVCGEKEGAAVKLLREAGVEILREAVDASSGC